MTLQLNLFCSRLFFPRFQVSKHDIIKEDSSFQHQGLFSWSLLLKTHIHAFHFCSIKTLKTSLAISSESCKEVYVPSDSDVTQTLIATHEKINNNYPQLLVVVFTYHIQSRNEKGKGHTTNNVHWVSQIPIFQIY